jgi:hypothetical protein
MDEFAANHWNCPFPGCGAPLACRGSRETSYLSINPQIQTVVASLSVICDALNRAPPEWWNSSDSQEEVDVEQYSPEKCLEHSQQEEDEYSPEDSEQTEAFTRPKQSPRGDWMTPIIENRSCGLPSQSPGMSPISHMASQQEQQHMAGVRMENIPKGERETSGARESPISSHPPENESTMNTKIPSVPSVLVASALSTKDFEILEALQTTNKLTLVTGANQNTEAAVDYAVCGNAEMTTGDGFLVGRTFAYLLAVARGIPIVNISYFQEETEFAQLDEEYKKHQVIGDVESTEWMAPQRAIKSKQEGIALLDGYNILLFGDFESLPKSPASKRSRSGVVKKNQESIQATYSLERLQCLLQACGATIVHDVTSLVGLSNDKVAVMLRPDPHPRDWRAARKELEKYPTLPLIRGNWLLDSISNFQVKDVNDYTQVTIKK